MEEGEEWRGNIAVSPCSLPENKVLSSSHPLPLSLTHYPSATIPPLIKVPGSSRWRRREWGGRYNALSEEGEVGKGGGGRRRGGRGVGVGEGGV